MADSIRNGDTQVAQVHGGSAAFAQLSAIPDVRTSRIATPRVLNVSLRATEPKLAQRQVRKAILGLLDVDLLAAVGAGSDNTVTLDQAQVRAPSDPGYVATAPPAMDSAAALALLEASGYKVEKETASTSVTPTSEAPPPGAPPAPEPRPQEMTRGRVSMNGHQLSLVIGAASNDPTSVAVANTAADQLRNVGIAATVLPLDPVKLYRDALTHNQVDAVVGWREAGGDLATLLASRYGCSALEATPVSTRESAATASTSSPAPPASEPGSTTPTSTKRAPQPGGAGALVQAPSNITGICDPALQANIDAALDGSKDIDEVISAVEPRLWNMATVLPILQDTTIVAAGSSVADVSLSGAVPVGIVGDAGGWVKTP
jgi:ABC-type transport system substrate-binding protein